MAADPPLLADTLHDGNAALNSLEMEIVFLEVSARDALVRVPVAFMLLPKTVRPWRDQPSKPEQDK